ncbi:MAG: glycosyltransferase family 2 protein [Candidatus Buchananbacteria bacterium]|nr:glycosyltransferase family 2 protein [Candidatus Buchananbacteria bacterium]
MSLPKVTIQIVTWNSLKYLPFVLESIFNQTYRDFQVLVIDNNSQDETVDFIRKNYPEVTVFKNKKNLGFAKANNQGIRLLHSPCIILCNQDIVLENNWLEIIMSKVESDDYEDVGSFGGKLLKLKPSNGEIDQTSKTNTIDSCGLKINRHRRITEIGAGEDSGKFNEDREVFGCSGALVLYRRDLLEDCLIKTKNNPQGEYFDEDFISYKEDVDLAWRARILGWKSMFISSAIAYHVRSVSGSENNVLVEIIKNRKKQSSLAKYYSYRNHFLLLIKNEFTRNFFHDFWQIKWFEVKKAAYIFIFEVKNIKAWLAVLVLLPKMLAKRKEIFKKAKVDYGQMSNWLKK